MSRFLRELRETEGKPSAAKRFARGLSALGVLAGGSLTGSCLITNEFAFKPPDAPPTVVALSPLGFDRVPNLNDPDCPDAPTPSLRFDFLVTEPDREALVYARLYINGYATLNFFRLNPDSDGSSTRRAANPICIPHASFAGRLCNRVQLVVSKSFDDANQDRSPPDGALNPRVNTVQWFVLAQSQNAADAVPSDCAQLLARDAGAGVTLPDGSVISPPSDGGSLLPVGTVSTTSDGGP